MLTRKPSFIKQVYVSAITQRVGRDLNRTTELEGWITLSITEKDLAHLAGHNIKVKVTVIEDLGKEQPTKPKRRYKCKKTNETK